MAAYVLRKEKVAALQKEGFGPGEVGLNHEARAALPEELSGQVGPTAGLVYGAEGSNKGQDAAQYLRKV